MSETAPFSGPFKAGYDPRRSSGGRQRVEVWHGQTIAELAQLHTHECINVLACVIAGLDPENPEEPKQWTQASILRSVELLLSYGHGKPVDQIKLQEVGRVIGGASLENLSTDQLIGMLDQPEKAG